MSKRPCNNEERVSTNEKTLVGSGLRNSLHGNVFQLKLLMLFLIRGIGKNYHQFQLATEMPGMGGKFDDLVFRYQSTEKAQERYRYLQAKHKQDETVKIKAKDLLKDNEESEFSLAKYFRSFCRDIKGEADASRLDTVQDCIICTNIGIDKKDLENEGIKLEKASPPLTHNPSITGQLDILAFETVRGGKTAVWHKLKSTDILRQKIREWSDIHSLAKKLLEIAETDKKRLELRNELFKNYHVALFKENVMVRQGAKGRLHSDFLTRQNSQNKVIQKFGQILSHVTFVHYCENLTFTEKTQKMIKVDQKQIKDFDDKSLPSASALPKHSKKMEWDFEVFSQYRHDLVDCQNVLIISSRGKTSNTLKFSKEFVIGSSRLSAEAAAFRETLCNYFFVHHWKDLTFQLSENFGHSQNGTTDKSLDNFVKEEDIDQFLDKLIIVNNMPNEVELGKFLTKEIGQHYKVMDSDFQSSYILENMLDWFKEENSNWYSSVKGKRLLKGGKQKMKTFRATSLSLDYQQELNGVLSFNEIAVEKMAGKLKSFLVPFISESSNLKLKRISVELHITSSSPELTAVKVFAALKHPIMADIDSTNFQRDDSYLATSSGRLQKGSEKKWMKHALTKEGNPSLLIVIVCEANGIVEVVKESEDDHRKSEGFLFSQDEFESLINGKKRVITIGTTKKTDFVSSVVDKITYGQLSDKSKLMLLSKTVAFQKNQIQGDPNKADSNEKYLSTVDQLIGCDDCENVLDAPSIEELMFERKPSGTQIPSYSASVFEQTLYIKRRILFDFHFNDGFWTEVAESLNKREGEPRFSSEKLQKQCRIDSKTGSMEWTKDIDRDLQKKIWEEIIEQSKKLSKKQIYEDDLLEHILSKTYFTTEGNRQRQAVIISGVAGTGKSTLLSYFYDEIKKKNPTTWVIRINLTDYQKALKEFLIDNSGIDRLTVFNFLINLIPVENNSVRSLILC